MKTFKAFDADLKCKGFQFDVGKEYQHDGKVEICNSGFHSCENPLDCLSYYDLCESRFAQVTASGETKNHNNDSKIASAKIFIDCELRLPEFIKSCVNYLIENNIDSSQLAASGDSSIIMSSGKGSKAKVGKRGVIVLSRFVEKEKRFRVSVGYEGEGIDENVFYKLDDDGNFIKA